MKGFQIMTTVSSDTVEQVFAGNPSLSADHYKRLYARVLTDEQKEQFAALPVDRQMGLMCVPVRRQKRYKETGIDAYMSEAKGAGPQRTKNRVTKGDKQLEKYIIDITDEGEDYNV